MTTGGVTTTTYYIRDAQGNVLATYEGTTKKEQTLYGSSRLGVWYAANNLRGYELTNHLGNVVATIANYKIYWDRNGDGVVDDHTVHTYTAQDYYPFGMTMPGRSYTLSIPGGPYDFLGYRYGFNGKENENEISGWQNYGFREYDERLGRFISMDPIASDYPWYTPYQFAGNKPIIAADLDGLEEWMKSQELAIKRQVEIKMMSDKQKLMDVGTIRAYNPADRSWTQKWRDSKNFLAQITYSAANGLYTLPQQLGSSLTGQKQINNIGGNTHDAHGIFGEKQRVENGINGLTTLMPGAAAEEAGTSLLSKYSNKLLTKIENQVTEQVVKKELFSNFSNLDDLAKLFNGKNLSNSADELLTSGWKKIDGNWGSKTVFEKQIGKERYYATWEASNMEHSIDNLPTSYWKLTKGKISAYGENVRRVSDAPNFNK